MGGIETGWGLQVILWFQSWRTPLVESLGLVFHTLGSQEFFLILLPFIYWCVDASLGRRLTALFVLNAWLNGALKDGWKRPRPYEVSLQVRNVLVETSYGIPSGHAQNATLIAGALALEARRWWATLLAIWYALLMALSRMVLGVHFPQDVGGGLLVGLVLLGLYAWLEPTISAWLKRQSLAAQIGVVVTAVLVMGAISPGLIPPRNVGAMESAGTALGTLLGLGIGLALAARVAPFDAGGAWWKRLLRFALGGVIVFALRFGLGVAFAGLEPALAWRILRYALIGLWAAVGAPWVFLTIRLAGRADVGPGAA